MIEDMAKNLRPAADLGMMTVWLRHNKDWSSEDSEGDHIHYAIDDLKLWLKEIIN
jgi:putative hydrolase of the HAD superfamily